MYNWLYILTIFFAVSLLISLPNLDASDAVVYWYETTYKICDTATVGVVSFEDDMDHDSKDIVSIQITSDSDPVGVNLDMLEGGVHTAVFYANIELCDDLKVSEGDRVYATFGSIQESVLIKTTPVESTQQKQEGVYQNLDYGFSIEFPDGWFVSESVIKWSEDHIWIVEFGRSETVFDPRIMIYIDNRDYDPNFTDQEFLEFIKDNAPNSKSYSSTTNSKITSITGLNAFQFSYQSTIGGSRTGLITVIPDGENNWWIAASGDKENWKEYGYTIRKSVNSFKLLNLVDEIEKRVPEWVKNNAKWWSEGQIGDSDFISGIQYLIKEDLIKVSSTVEAVEKSDGNIPLWIRNNAAWWADGLISEDDFLNGIKHLVEKGIIRV